MIDFYDLLDTCPDSFIADSFIVSNKKIKDYKKIVCSISGGSDSDIMLDLFARLDKDKKITYVFFNTGLEYQATKDHLKFLEEKYNITINVINAKKPIPITCKKIGQPFLSKSVSRRIAQLQAYGFKFEDKPIDELLAEYCEEIPKEKALENPKLYYECNGKYYRGCCTAIRWWCNKFMRDDGVMGQYNIGYNKYLKEFMVANPPTFAISDKCCKYAKKDPVHSFIKENEFDLNCYGVRKAEGGARSVAYKNCFTDNTAKDKSDEYRPIFWYKNETKEKYEECYGVTHSKCYTEYGLTRTGCAGCPFGRDFEKELEIIEKYEPKLYKAVNNIFGESYDYTRKYREFVKEMKLKEKASK